MAATVAVPAPHTAALGRIEETGVEHIPESERDSRPANLFAVFLGGNLAFSVIVFGWLPITFGLGWKRYDADDLQVFNRGERGGRYWFTGGWNLRAAGAWAAGSAFGLLAVDTQLYTGPLAGLADGVDLSLAGSGAIAAAVYVAALKLWPER